MKNLNTVEIDTENLKQNLDEHLKWIRGEQGGKRANLCGANLCGADLRDANLSDADLYGADLRDANLCGANLCGADLRGADLRDTDLRNANLYGADLRDTDLRDANLDYSSWPLWCGSLNAKANEKIVAQLLYHTLRVAQRSEISAEMKTALFTKEMVEQANKFHRVNECGEITLEAEK